MYTYIRAFSHDIEGASSLLRQTSCVNIRKNCRASRENDFSVYVETSGITHAAEEEEKGGTDM